MQSYQPKKPNRQAYRFYQLEKPKRTTDRIYQHCVSNKEALRAFVKRQTLEERDALQLQPLAVFLLIFFLLAYLS